MGWKGFPNWAQRWQLLLVLQLACLLCVLCARLSMQRHRRGATAGSPFKALPSVGSKAEVPNLVQEGLFWVLFKVIKMWLRNVIRGNARG